MRGILTKDISPREFVAAAEELGKGFAETLKLIATLQLGGQGQGPAPEGKAAAEAEAA